MRLVGQGVSATAHSGGRGDTVEPVLSLHLDLGPGIELRVPALHHDSFYTASHFAGLGH